MKKLDRLAPILWFAGAILFFTSAKIGKDGAYTAFGYSFLALGAMALVTDNRKDKKNKKSEDKKDE
jgi:hypothetical protein